ncbi:hypothetical protein EV426DRAFT_365891 [Tirmania nivea]|nr:hypothetical protein EV426DRAFT_365891 [Tirmania nivea]
MATTPSMEEVHGTGAAPEERLPTTTATIEDIILTTHASYSSSISSPSEPSPNSAFTSMQVLGPTPPGPPTQQPSITTNPTPDETVSGHEPPAYSPTPPPPSPSTPRSPSPPPPPLPPSPVITQVTLPATRPASFPLLPTNPNIPSYTARPYTFHQSPPPAFLPPHHSITIDIFPDSDANPHSNEEPLPTYSRYPKHGEEHCLGEIGDPDGRSDISGSTWDRRSRRQQKRFCCCGMYTRTVITGIVVLIIACVIAGGVVGWQMKAKYEHSSSPPSSLDWKMNLPSKSNDEIPPF